MCRSDCIFDKMTRTRPVARLIERRGPHIADSKVVDKSGRWCYISSLSGEPSCAHRALHFIEIVRNTCARVWPSNPPHVAEFDVHQRLR